MPSANVSEKDCGERRQGIRRRFKFTDWLTTTLIALITLLMGIQGWSGCASQSAAKEAADANGRFGEHIASDEAGDKAVARSLESMEARQIRMGERIDGIYERLGE